MIVSGRILCLSVMAILGAGAIVVADEASDTTSMVADLLQVGWHSSPEAFPSALKDYEALRGTSPDDPRVPFAMALVAIKRQRNHDAQTYLAEALQGGKAVLPIRRTKIWLDALLKDHAAVLADIKALAEVLAADDALAARKDFQEAAMWLGCVMGYYAGPVKGELKGPEWDALQAAVTAKLKGPLADAFEKGKQATAKQFTQTLDDEVAAKKEAGQKNETKRLAEQQQNAQALQDARDKRDRADKAYNAFEIVLEESTRQANETLQKLAEQIADCQRQIRDAADELGAALSQDDTSNINATEDQAIIDREKANENYLIRQVNTVRANLKRLEASGQPLAKELNRLQILEKWLTAKAEKLALPASADDVTSMALAVRVNSISNYAPVDLEAEKKQILDSYAAE